MAKTTWFIVQPFETNKRGWVRATTPIVARDEAHARRIAEKMVARVAGVIAVSRACDPDMGEYDPPEIICELGGVPAYALEELAA